MSDGDEPPDAEGAIMTTARGDEGEEGKTRRMDLSYMHRPPRIVPNYGKKATSVLPKSSVSRVLLYDNVTQQQMLDVKLSSLTSEKHKAGRILDLHRKSFLLRRMMKQQHAQEHKTVTHAQPEVLDIYLPILISENTPDEPREVPRISIGESPVRLPQLVDGRGTGDGGGLHVECKGGVTRVMHTLDSSRQSGVRSGVESRRTLPDKRTVLDKRFQGLENLLVTLEDPGNGYIELSPSYPRESTRIPDNLMRLGFMMTRNLTES